MPSSVAGKVTRWRARYVDNAGKEHTRHFDRKVDAQRWLKEAMASIVRGDHVAPKVARLTVGEWSDKWLDGYRTRRKSTVRQAEVHLKLIKEHFGAVPMASVKPSDVRGWTARLKAEGRADSYVYALHARLSQLFSDAVHDGIVPRNPCSRRTSPGTGKQRPYVATTEQIWALHNAVPAGIRPAILLGAHAGLRLAEAAALRPKDVDFRRRSTRQRCCCRMWMSCMCVGLVSMSTATAGSAGSATQRWWLAWSRAVDVDHCERRLRPGPGDRRWPRFRRRRRLAEQAQPSLAEPDPGWWRSTRRRHSRGQSASSCPTPRSASSRCTWCSSRT